MTARSKLTGYPIHYDAEAKTWVYTDTGVTVGHGSKRCGKCGKKPGEAGIDPCLVPLVAAINGAGLKTRASCCGHGFMPPIIMLEDGREVIVARTFDEARKMQAAIKIDINGNPIRTRTVNRRRA